MEQGHEIAEGKWSVWWWRSSFMAVQDTCIWAFWSRTGSRWRKGPLEVGWRHTLFAYMAHWSGHVLHLAQTAQSFAVVRSELGLDSRAREGMAVRVAPVLTNAQRIQRLLLSENPQQAVDRWGRLTHSTCPSHERIQLLCEQGQLWADDEVVFHLERVVQSARFMQ